MPTNLYNVDTTGKSYALDAAPLMRIDDKRVAVEGAKQQAMLTLAQQGAMAAETYTARKQLAQLSTSQQQLKPGTPEFERDVANLIQQHPLAFNNPYTASAAKLGLSSLASAHAQALKQQDQTQQNNFMIQRDKARFQAEKDIAETRYRKTQKAPLSLGDLVGDPSVSPSQNAEPVSAPGSGDAPDLPSADEKPSAPDGTLLNSPEPDLPVTSGGAEGPKGPPGLPAPPAAVAIPDTKTPVVKKSDPINLDDGITDSLAKAQKYEAAARALEQNDQPAEAAAARMKAIDFKAQAQKIQGSDEYQQRVQERLKAKKAAEDTAEIEAKSPEVSAALAGGYPELGDLHGEMDKEITGAKSKVELARLQSKWANKMATARQLMQSEGKLPDDPSKIEEVAIKRDAAIRAAQAADAAENEVGKYADKVKPGASPEVTAYANKLKARRDAAQAKAQKEAEAYDVLKTKVGMNEPEDTADTGPKPGGAKVESGTPATLDDQLVAKMQKEYPDLYAAAEKIVKEKPWMESMALSDAMKPYRDPKDGQLLDPKILKDFEQLGLDPKDAFRRVVQRLRAGDADVSGNQKSKNPFTIIK